MTWTLWSYIQYSTIFRSRTIALFLSLCPGVWAVSFMRWSQADLCSLDRLLRMSFTSYSVSLVRHAFMFVCVYTQTYISWPSFSSTGTPTEETWPGITTSEEFKTYNFPRYHAEPLVNHAPRCVDWVYEHTCMCACLCLYLKWLGYYVRW